MLPYILEYVAYKRLPKLGFTQSMDDLDEVTAEVLLFIDAEYNSIMGQEMDKATKAGKR